MFQTLLKKFFCAGLLLVVFFTAQSQTVTGKITDDKQHPVADAFIYLLNTNAATFTDAQGNFTFKNINAGKYTLAVSAIGYASITEALTVGNTNAALTIQLADATAQLDAVIVTAQKKEEALQDIPVSISAISAKQVQQLRLWNTKDLTAVAPNLALSNSGDERNVASIRGIVTTSYDPAVATYIDGVNQFSLDTYIASLNDIERIEVLRGPQGTLYGRNAMGGVINIVTKQPTNTTNGFIELNAGNYGLQRYTAGIRTPLVKGKLFFGATGAFNKRDGFYTNTFNNSTFDKQQNIAGNYYLKYLPGSNWSVTLNLKHQAFRNNGAFPLVNGIDEAINNPFQLSQNATAKMIDNTLNTSLVINHAGPGFAFTSQTAYQQNHRYYNAPLDGDFSPADIVTVINDYGNKWNNVKVFTQEFRFNSAASKSAALKWTAGTYFFHQNNPSKQATHFGEDAGLYGIPDVNFATINSATGKNTGIAFYGQLSYAITSKFEITGGLRYDYENKKLDVEGAYQKDGEDAFIIRPDTAASLHYSAVSPKVGLSYHISNNSNLFATYNRGFRTGGLTQLSSDPSQPPLYPYKPEYSNNYEAGIKNSFLKNRLRINITLFATEVTNAQVPTLVLPDAITVTRNTGKLSSKGAEFELSATPIKGLEIDYNLGYTHAEYTSLKISQNGESVNLNGKRQIFTPDVTSMLAIQYSCGISEDESVKFVARAEWFYLGTEYFDLANNIKQSPYSLFNTRIGVTSKHFDLFLWNRNIGNQKYISYAYDFGAIHLGDPQIFGATFTMKLK